MVPAGCSASHEAYGVAVTSQRNQQGTDAWNPAADSSEMASGVPQEVNEAPQANHPTAQGTVGENCAFMRYPARTHPT